MKLSDIKKSNLELELTLDDIDLKGLGVDDFLNNSSDEEEPATQDNNEFDKYKSMVQETIEIDSNLSSTEIGFTTKTRQEPVLVIEIANELEGYFLKSLICEDNKKEYGVALIELCIRFEDIIKPIGFLEFTFDNVMKLWSYNKEFQLSILRDREFPLTRSMALNLP